MSGDDALLGSGDDHDAEEKGARSHAQAYEGLQEDGFVLQTLSQGQRNLRAWWLGASQLCLLGCRAVKLWENNYNLSDTYKINNRGVDTKGTEKCAQ